MTDARTQALAKQYEAIYGTEETNDHMRPEKPERIETEVLSGAEMQALISAGRVLLSEAPQSDPLRMVLASAVGKLSRAVRVPHERDQVEVPG